MPGLRTPLSLLMAAFMCAAASAQSPTARVTFADSIKEVPAATAPGKHRAVVSRTVLRTEERSASISFEVALRMRNFDELQARVAKGEQIAPAEMASRYFPLAVDHDKLVAWLKAQGLVVTRTDGNRLAVFGRGSVDALAAAFQVTFARVAVADGEFTSAVTPPSLPSDIAPAVLGIHGLQPHIRRHPLSIPQGAASPRLVVVGSYLPSSIAAAYNATGLSVTGTGQTIAVYALGFPQTSDLSAFWADAGITRSLSSVQLITVGVGPPSSTSSGSLEEATLDTEWTSALAPGANVRVYGASEDDPGDNDEILQQVYADIPSQPTMHQLCICIGGNETEVEKDYLIIEAQYMANLASAGVSVLVASGDTGAYADTVLQTTYPTSDPDVTGVGGTTLTLSGTTVTSETAWPMSGGGQSVVFSRPSWQAGTGVPAGTMRLVPDVAADADPSPGVTIVYNGKQVAIGGTSVSTPIWTAFCALLNQNRSTPLGLLNPRLYPLIGSSSFRDITAGNNGYYNAGVGYDLCTGIGVPNLTNLLANALSTTTGVTVPAQLGNVITVVGQPATFFVVGEGAASLSYQWQRLPAGSSTWANLADSVTYGGTATPTLVVTGTTLAMTGDQFRCAVTASSGSATSTPAASLTVNQVGVTTMAGWPGSAGSTDGKGWAARFAYPGSVRTDTAGNIYVADSYNNTVRKVTPAGVVTTVAGIAGQSGSTNGPAATALFSGTAGVAVDPAGDLFVADDSNYVIREISAAGTVSTLAGTAGSRGEVDGAGSAARFYDPQNLAIDSAGNLYVADGLGNVIRKVTPSGVVSTLAGAAVNGGAARSGSADGTGTAAQFNDPTGVAVDLSGNVYVADEGNDTVRVITPAGAVSTLAGSARAGGSSDGTGSTARFDGPAGLCVDLSGNLYVADSNNDTIREVSPAGVVTTVAGSPGVEENSDGLSANARFWTPGDITIDSTGVLYVADAGNQTIRRLVGGAVAAPSVTAQPVSQAVGLGATAEFSVGVTGTAPFAFQWYLNGAAIYGATGPTYTVADAQESNEGSYSVGVSNALGSATSAAASLSVTLPAGYPDITAQPLGTTLAFGGSTVLTVAVTGTAPFTYQWYLNGSGIAGTTSAAYTATAPGSYTVTVTNAVASATSSPAVVSPGSRLAAISSRALVGTGGSVTIAGISVYGPAGVPKQVLIRGVGPTLSAFGLANLLAAPTLSVFNSAGTVVATNTGWETNSNPAQIALVASQVGAFALATGSADSALLADLVPGNYTVELSGVASTTGVGLVEVYETNTSDPAVLASISTRAQVGAGGSILIGGFSVNGSQSATVLVRGVGPALAAFGVSGPLANPTLTVFNSAGAPVAANTGWGNATAAAIAQVTSVEASVGAFPLTPGSADSALVLMLAPGQYTAQVSSANGMSGIALVEIYQVAP